uniref:RRM domain-containing protein n=1 Tax=Quercus lobata TaxID=97700 RepID=A0A7N2LGH4_QUELO
MPEWCVFNHAVEDALFKIIMDKISKRSKSYAFIEYTTEEAASAAPKEMNGKIINGWMIVVDVAKTNPPRYSRGRPR